MNGIQVISRRTWHAAQKELIVFGALAVMVLGVNKAAVAQNCDPTIGDDDCSDPAIPFCLVLADHQCDPAGVCKECDPEDDDDPADPTSGNPRCAEGEVCAAGDCVTYPDPAGCAGSAVSCTFEALDPDSLIPINFPVIEGQQIRYRVRLGLSDPTTCNFFGGQLGFTFPPALTPPIPPPGQFVEAAGYPGTPHVPQVRMSAGGSSCLDSPVYTVDSYDVEFIAGVPCVVARYDYGSTVVHPEQIDGAVLSYMLHPANCGGAYALPVAVPEIEIVQSGPQALCGGVPTSVTYDYTVTIPGNPGNQDLENVAVTDDACAPVVFVGGDGDGDDMLDLEETWTFECVTTLDDATTNTATATAEFSNPFATVTVVDTDTSAVQVLERSHPADLNCDGMIDHYDLSILLSNWGPCD